MRETQIEIRNYNRKDEIVNVNSCEFCVHIKKITDEVIKKLLELH